ncbi:AlpA family phage regulatory protein [Francisella frigiditurris]|uniref:MerR HTH regulatory family protein n=1 Tax=Francisella frigiditurris TaxID=1542390 RepID=A0A1J0KUG9_9GAMM|nr:AlpA family phage regulatory protein [Francisella frigiditurris]APC97339.1 merR HTH regulatory family protein [Francisella frigiditurris]
METKIDNKKVMRIEEVIELTGTSRSTIYRWVSEGSFIKPIKLSATSIGFLATEVEASLDSKIQRDMGGIVMELMNLNNKVIMTSRDIAELTGKQHSHIIRDIKSEIDILGEEIGPSIFGLSSYISLQNKEQPQYIFGKKELCN